MTARTRTRRSGVVAIASSVRLHELPIRNRRRSTQLRVVRAAGTTSVTTASGGWVSHGLRNVRSTPTTYRSADATLIGSPGWYLRRDGFAWGGIGGTGPGLGSPDRIPAAETDFIFAVIAEELGLLGATAVLVGFLLLVGVGLRVALRATRPFETLLATGLTTILGVQAFIIMGGVTRLVPLTGITLPFVSYGGSSLVSNYVLLALLIRLSDSTARRLREVPDTPTTAERWAARRLRRRTSRMVTA